MNAYQAIKAKQKQWALSHGITLTGSQGGRGTPAYTTCLDLNLFEPLSLETRRSFAGECHVSRRIHGKW